MKSFLVCSLKWNKSAFGKLYHLVGVCCDMLLQLFITAINKFSKVKSLFKILCTGYSSPLTAVLRSNPQDKRVSASELFAYYIVDGYHIYGCACL